MNFLKTISVSKDFLRTRFCSGLRGKTGKEVCEHQKTDGVVHCDECDHSRDDWGEARNVHPEVDQAWEAHSTRNSFLEQVERVGTVQRRLEGEGTVAQAK